MKKRISPLTILILIITLMLSGCVGNINSKVSKQKKITAEYLEETIKNPSVGSIAGDWVVFDLKKSNKKVPKNYYDNYYDNVRGLLKAKNGKITEDMYTNYARIAIALKSIGKDPENVEGYNLLKPLDDKEVVVSQGINGPIYSIIAAHYCGYELENLNTYLEYIIENMKEGNELEGDFAEVDYNGMALQALAYYQDNQDVKKTIDNILSRLSILQKEDGSFGNCEATSQVILGLCANGIDPLEMEKLNKSGKTLIDGLLKYAKGDGFVHSLKEGKPNQMATEQGMMALIAYSELKDGKMLLPDALKSKE